MSMDNHELGRGSMMTPRLIVGLAIALFGVVLVFDRLNLVVADQALRWWPAVIVAIGAVIFNQSRRVGGGINGVIVMVIGALAPAELARDRAGALLGDVLADGPDWHRLRAGAAGDAAPHQGGARAPTRTTR